MSSTIVDNSRPPHPRVLVNFSYPLPTPSNPPPSQIAHPTIPHHLLSPTTTSGPYYGTGPAPPVKRRPIPSNGNIDSSRRPPSADQIDRGLANLQGSLNPEEYPDFRDDGSDEEWTPIEARRHSLSNNSRRNSLSHLSPTFARPFSFFPGPDVMTTGSEDRRQSFSRESELAPPAEGRPHPLDSRRSQVDVFRVHPSRRTPSPTPRPSTHLGEDQHGCRSPVSSLHSPDTPTGEVSPVSPVGDPYEDDRIPRNSYAPKSIYDAYHDEPLGAVPSRAPSRTPLGGSLRSRKSFGGDNPIHTTGTIPRQQNLQFHDDRALVSLLRRELTELKAQEDALLQDDAVAVRRDGMLPRFAQECVKVQKLRVLVATRYPIIGHSITHNNATIATEVSLLTVYKLDEEIGHINHLALNGGLTQDQRDQVAHCMSQRTRAITGYLEACCTEYAFVNSDPALAGLLSALRKFYVDLLALKDKKSFLKPVLKEPNDRLNKGLVDLKLAYFTYLETKNSRKKKKVLEQEANSLPCDNNMIFFHKIEKEILGISMNKGYKPIQDPREREREAFGLEVPELFDTI